MFRKVPENVRPFAALAVMTITWGYNWVVMKEGLRYCGPFDFAALRVVFGCACLFAILLWKGHDLRPRQVGLTILLGLISTTLGLGLPMWALESGGAGKTAVLLYTMPFWTVVMAWPLLGEKLSALEWMATCLAFAGLASIMDFTVFGEALKSSIIAVCAGMAWAASAILTRIMRRSPDFDLLSVTTWQMAYGMVPLVIIAYLVPSAPIQWNTVFISALIYNVLLTSVLAFILWFYVLQRLPAGMTTMGTLTTPVIALTAAYLQLGEVLSGREWFGIILILAGITLLTGLGIYKARRLKSA